MRMDKSPYHVSDEEHVVQKRRHAEKRCGSDDSSHRTNKRSCNGNDSNSEVKYSSGRNMEMCQKNKSYSISPKSSPDVSSKNTLSDIEESMRKRLVKKYSDSAENCKTSNKKRDNNRHHHKHRTLGISEKLDDPELSSLKPNFKKEEERIFDSKYSSAMYLPERSVGLERQMEPGNHGDKVPYPDMKLEKNSETHKPKKSKDHHLDRVSNSTNIKQEDSQRAPSMPVMPVMPVDNSSKNDKEQVNFGLSGKLTEYTNTYNGVVIKYNEPPDARKANTRWRLYPFKGDQSLEMLQIHRQSAYLLGRDRKIADIPIDHPSCSKQHAVFQFRLVPHEKPDGTMGRRVKPYIIDLETTNGTYVNNKRIEARRYVELREKDVLKFGFSSRDYVLLHEKSEDDKLDDVDLKSAPTLENEKDISNSTVDKSDSESPEIENNDKKHKKKKKKKKKKSSKT